MLFRSYRKRKALESYQTVLRRRLRGTHGKRDHYDPHDVVATARFYGLSETYLSYALAMYCDRAAFDAYHTARGDASSYDRLWHELRASVFVRGSDGSMNLSAMLDATATREDNALDFGDAADYAVGDAASAVGQVVGDAIGAVTDACDVSFDFGFDFNFD